MKTTIFGVRSPTASAITAVACGPIVTGAIRQSPNNPPRSHILQTNFDGSRSTGILNFLTNQLRRGAPASKTTAPPATYPDPAPTAANQALAPAATPAGIAAMK